VINQSIKFFTIFLLIFNVFAGGDDRDKEYYENLDEELATFEAQLAEDLANQAALEAFQQKLAEEKAAAAASTAAYQSQLEYDAKVAELMEALQLQMEIDAFEAELAAELSKQAAESASAEMTAEIIAEERAKRLAEFQAKVEAEKAAAARSTAIYQARQLQDQMIKDRQAQLALERELAAFEAQLEAELAAEEMMAEILEEEARANRLAEFLAQLEAEKAAAAASTAAYQAKVASEEVIGVIEEVVVTVAAHEECKHTLNLSDSNIELFKTALAGGYLFSVGPQITAGTEFTANRWDDYASCIGALNYKNPF